jgi:hypothetical protein
MYVSELGKEKDDADIIVTDYFQDQESRYLLGNTSNALAAVFAVE